MRETEGDWPARCCWILLKLFFFVISLGYICCLFFPLTEWEALILIFFFPSFFLPKLNTNNISAEIYYFIGANKQMIQEKLLSLKFGGRGDVFNERPLSAIGGAKMDSGKQTGEQLKHISLTHSQHQWCSLFAVLPSGACCLWLFPPHLLIRMPRSFHASDLAATLYRFASSLSHSPQVIYKYIYPSFTGAK